MTDDHLPTRTEGEGETLDMPEGLGWFSQGQVLGERYQILEMLGRGGMGEVWKAFDLKLRVEVALKALREDLFKSEGRRDLLRQEVRAAREVVSPNVCRIFDLIEIDGRELVSMEYVDGGTLFGLLSAHGPLELKEAQDIASQFLAGLEAIHQAGLVHRDVKPENIMITRAGRVVLMDFGLAMGPDSGEGRVAGTPAYMSPEHLKGDAVDARADVYAAGVVLAEMVSPHGVKDFESRQSVWEGIRHEPAKVPDTPWAPVLETAVAKNADERYSSAHTLIRELEKVTLRISGEDELNPYPGLATFTEQQAEFFFGREAEVEAMWRTLELPHLLAVIGPSGAGKSSFLRAGLIPIRPPGWSCIITTPGSSPFVALAQALVPEFAGEPDAIVDLVRTDDLETMISAVSRWRSRHDQALLIVDQFEELFTLNTPDAQDRFAEFLGRLAVEADVRVLLSMRDDFLFQCETLPALRPVFSEITPLGPLVGAALRRALVQPASTCGYRFEDDALVDEMLGEVEGERGSLPLLAFAVNRLWEARDRGDGLLTREAYQRIGGVVGALAKHAEDTLEEIGEERIPIAREVFRNLVTAQGTRAVRERDELLSVFGEANRGEALDVLNGLIDSRLLTNFEIGGDDDSPRSMVEIVHEALIEQWPRLVRWQTQDVDAAQLRDQLRQAARTWDGHGRSKDLLWAGTAYREYAVWRERYPGGLTELEEDFASAMTSHAKRRKRFRRFAAAAVLAVLLAVLAVVVVSRQQAVQEARRAEASKLLALAEGELDEDRAKSNPATALAYVISSLELFDSDRARLMALEALWNGPLGSVVSKEWYDNCAFSPDGEWLAHRFGGVPGNLALSHREGGARVPFGEAPQYLRWLNFNPESNHLLATSVSGPWSSNTDQRTATVWSVPDGREIQRWVVEGGSTTGEPVARRAIGLRSRESVEIHLTEHGTRMLYRPLDGGPAREEMLRRASFINHSGLLTVNNTGTVAVYSNGPELWAVWLDGSDLERHVGVHDGNLCRLRISSDDQIVASADRSGSVRLWALDVPRDHPVEVFQTRENPFYPQLVVEHRMLLVPNGLGTVQIFDLEAPRAADPSEYHLSGAWQIYNASLDPSGQWLLAQTFGHGPVMWPVSRRHPLEFRGHTDKVYSVAFAPDGRFLVSGGGEGAVRLWPLARSGGPSQIVFELPTSQYAGAITAVAVAPSGKFLVVSGGFAIWVVPLDGGEPWPLHRFDVVRWPVAVGPDSRQVATAGGGKVFIWDLERGSHRVLSLGEDRENIVFHFAEFTPDGNGLITGGEDGMFLWNLEDGSSKSLGPGWGGRLSEDGHLVAAAWSRLRSPGDGSVGIYDLETLEFREIGSHGGASFQAGFDRDTKLLISTGTDEIVRVGSVEGDEPHLLLGPQGWVYSPVVSPDNRWIATGGDDGVVRLWPMPDISKPPLHTLPHNELVAKLKTFSNLRAVRDEASPKGWRIDYASFPGWAEVPEW